MTKLQEWFYKYNAWSFTKHRLWGQCRRAYYYSYIGPALQGPTTISVQKLKQLKKLDSKSILQGKLIHEVLEHQMEQHRLGRGTDEEKARNEYIGRVEYYRKNAERLMVEPANGEGVDQAFFDRIRESGLDQLSMFFGVFWPQLVGLRYLRHEKFDRFHTGHTEAIVKVDYVSKAEDGQVVISDWKTGSDNPEYESDLQIGAYVLWAMEYYGLEPNGVKSELVYLTTGIARPYRFAQEKLKEIEMLIGADFEEMNRSYHLEYFEPTPSSDTCPSCHFASVCPQSMTHEGVL